MYSQQQLTHIVSAAAVIVLIAQQFGLILETNSIAFFLAAALSVGSQIYGFYDRFKKGDLTLGGFRVSEK